MSSTPSSDALPGGSLATGDVLARLDALLDRVDHDARQGLDAEARVGLVQAVVAVARRLEALRAVLAGEADRAGASEQVRGASLRSVLATQAQVTAGEASGWVYAGRELVAREGVRTAALAGSVSLRQARSIAAVLEALPEGLDAAQRSQAEQLLLASAERLDARALAGQARAVLEQVAPRVDAAEHELRWLDGERGRAHAARGLTFVPDGRGSVLLRGQLPVLEAASVERLVAAYTESDRRARERAADRLDRPSVGRTPQQRRADGLVALARAHTAALEAAAMLAGEPADRGAAASGGGASGNVRAGGSVPRLPWVAGDRPRVNVTMSYDTLLRRADQAGVLPDGTPVGAGELRRLLCDADLLPVVLGGPSEVLDVGRAHRLVTPEIRRALALRDGGCAFPGCAEPDPACEAHHIVPWWAGGATSLANTVLLCPHHHGTVEPLRFFNPDGRPRWQVRIAEGGLPEFLPPAPKGDQPGPLPHERARGEPDDP